MAHDYECSNCSSTNVHIDGRGLWDTTEQEWIFNDDGGAGSWCGDCDTFVDLKRADIPDWRPTSPIATHYEERELAEVLCSANESSMEEEMAYMDASAVHVARNVMSDGPGFIGDIFFIVFPSSSTQVIRRNQAGAWTIEEGQSC